jgi:hypothetical protein
MKSTFLLMVLLVAVLAISCDDDDTSIIKPLPVAGFKLDKPYYEEGDTVLLINKSRHAHSYLWKIDGEFFSTETHPVFFDYDLLPFGKTFRITLFAFDKDSLNYDSTEMRCDIARRRISDIHITHMSESFRQMIPQAEGKETRLIIFLGPAEEPFEWYGFEQSLWSKPFSRDQQLPWQYVTGSWATFAMNNTEWLFRISFEVDGPDDRITAAEFVVNPIKQPSAPYPGNPDKLRKFSLTNDDFSMDIIFSILP